MIESLTEKTGREILKAQQETNRLLEALLKVHGVKRQPASKLAGENAQPTAASKTGGGG